MRINRNDRYPEVEGKVGEVAAAVEANRHWQYDVKIPSPAGVILIPTDTFLRVPEPWLAPPTP